jgi:hypothetical protein
VFWKKKEKQVFFSAPGPSPWFLRASHNTITTTAGDWIWHSSEDRRFVGTTQLVSPAGDTVLLLGFHCYVLLIESSQLLIWHETRNEGPGAGSPVALNFTILDLPILKKISVSETDAESLHAPNRPFLFSGTSVAEFRFDTRVEEGLYPISPPAEFRKLPEILALGEYGPRNPRTCYGENIARAVFVFRFDINQVEVLPQDWFNCGNYDFGYQWIARVGREQGTGRIVGEGVRLGTFRLDASGSQVEEWFKQDSFHHPGRE